MSKKFVLIMILFIMILSNVNLPSDTFKQTKVNANSLSNIKISNTDKTNVILTSNTNCWTVLVYIDADNNLEKYAVSNIKSMLQGSIGVNKCVKFVIQIDRSANSNQSLGYSSEPLPGENVAYTGGRRYEITNGTLIPITGVNGTLGNVDMGNRFTLQSFLTWGMQTYPANHTVVVLWDHGSGSRGAMYDETNRTQLTPNDMKNAFQYVENVTNSKIDMIGFDACLMASTEMLIQLKTVTPTLVASENTEPADGWDYNSFFSTFKGTSLEYLTADAIGDSIVRSYRDYYNSIGNNKTTLGSYNTQDADYLMQTMNDFSKYLLQQLQNTTNNQNYKIAQALQQARNKSVSFSNYEVDLYNLMTNFQQGINDPKLQRLASYVKDAIIYTVNYRQRGTAMDNASGLNIFFRVNQNATWNGTYTQFNDFMLKTSWEKALVNYYKLINTGNYTNFINSHPLQLSSELDVYFNMFPQKPTTMSNTFTNPTSYSHQFFNFTVFTQSQSIHGGEIAVFDEIPGGKIDILNPSYIFPVPPFGNYFSQIYNINFTNIGWNYLYAEYIPIDSKIFIGSSPYSFTTPDFWVAPQSALIVPSKPANLGFSDIFQTGINNQFNFSIVNAGLSAYSGGTLQFWIYNEITQSYQLFGTHSVSNLVSGQSEDLSFSIATLASGIYDYQLKLDNLVIQSPYGSDFNGLPCQFVIQTPLDLMTIQVLYNGTPTYLLNGFFNSNVYNMNPSLELLYPTSNVSMIPPSFTFSFAISDGSYNLYLEYGSIAHTSWVLKDNVYTANSSIFPTFNKSYVYLLEGYAYSYILLTNLTGSENLLNQNFIYNSFDQAKSYVILSSLDLRLDKQNNQIFVNATLMNTHNVPVNSSSVYDWSFFVLYDLSGPDYIFSYRKDQGGLPNIPAMGTYNDVFTVNFNPNDYAEGEYIIYYEYFNSAGAIDPSRQIIYYPFYNSHDSTPPNVMLTLPSTIGVNQQFSINGSISDVNFYTASLSVNNQIIGTADSTANYILQHGIIMEKPSQIYQINLSTTFSISKTGTYHIKLIATDKGMNRKIITETITVTNQGVSTTSSLPETSSLKSSSQNTPGLEFIALVSSLVYLGLNKKKRILK